MHDAIVRSLIEVAIEVCQGEIQSARSTSDAAQLRGRMLVLQGTLADLWHRPEAMPPRLMSAQLIDALRKLGS
jgi:hypothetical protein